MHRSVIECLGLWYLALVPRAAQSHFGHFSWISLCAMATEPPNELAAFLEEAKGRRQRVLKEEHEKGGEGVAGNQSHWRGLRLISCLTVCQDL